jgi:hypothetical protein
MVERENRRQAEAAAAQHRAESDAADRQEAFQQAIATCPLPIRPEKMLLAGGLQLFNDEFIVAVAKDWGLEHAEAHADDTSCGLVAWGSSTPIRKASI